MEQIINKPYIAFDYESITVGATAVGLTSSKFSSYAASGTIRVTYLISR